MGNGLKTKILKINKPVRGYKKGDEVPVVCYQDGIPVDSIWRRKLKDAEHDSCVELIEISKPKNKDEKKEIKKTETKKTEVID